MHAIRDCIKVVGVWDKVVSQVDMARFFSLYLDNWIGVNLSPSNSVWHILFVVLMNVLWERCNKCIFINEWENDISLINRAKFNVKCIQESLIQDQQTPKGICRCSLTICWRYPPTRWGKLDCDGALSSNSNLANVAKVHRDDNGFFFFLFDLSYYLGSCSIVQPELQAILKGVQVATSRGFSKIIVESNSLMSNDH